MLATTSKPSKLGLPVRCTLSLRLFGNDSPHAKNFESAYVRYTGYENGFLALKGIFLAGKSDYDGGHLFRLETAISGEIFADFVVLSNNALANNQKDVAALLACAALEDASKRYATLNRFRCGWERDARRYQCA